MGTRSGALTAALLLAGCTPSSRQTSVFIRVDFDSQLTVDQLQFEGIASSGEAAFGPTRLPEQPGAALSPGQTVLVQLDDGWSSASITLEVIGLWRERLAGTGEQAVTVRSGREVDAAVSLLGAFVGGDGGLPRCPSDFCTSGCCTGEACLPGSTLQACGAAGAACVFCDPVVADGCISGRCQCGSATLCAPGQHCVAGQCRCDAVSCVDGCCQGSLCVTRLGIDACGTGGTECASCTSTSDRCSSGTCVCGPGITPCAGGLRCDSGACVCDALSCPGCCAADGSCAAGDDTVRCGLAGRACSSCPAGETCKNGVCSGCSAASCPSGCCAGSNCLTPSLSACGLAGSACLSCDPALADNCTSGRCQCGSTGICRTGQHCVSGNCVCDTVSCPIGCCSGADCITATAMTLCGTSGSSCEPCNPALADRCTLAGCSCGGGPACNSTEACILGSCRCDAASCAGGCCAPTGCVLAPGLLACGAGGRACVACDPVVADTCSGGVCACGTGSACASGQHCLNGSCVCDGVSCPTSCCSGSTCVTPSTPSLCGTAGSHCTSCDGLVSDSCSSGACTCGQGPACGLGLRCLGGACQ